MKRITNNALKTIIQDNSKKPLTHNISFTVGDKTVDIIVKRIIPLTDVVALINSILENAFDGEIYNSVAQELAYQRGLLAYFTNLPYKGDNDIFDSLIYNTDIYQQIKNHISSRQLMDINRMIINAVNFKKEELLSHHRVLLDTAIATLNKEQENISQEIQNFMQAWNDRFSAMDFDVDKLERILDKAKDIVHDDVSAKVVSQIGDNPLD